jgi:LmbE family N-acetylglucosaminyl deacetylase
MIEKIKSALIIAPHPDDETLGVGGTIAKMVKKGIKVNVLIVSGHLPPLYSNKEFEITKKECLKSLRILGVKNIFFLKIPATKIHEIPVSELNGKIKKIFDQIKPEIVFIPFPDRHIDHKTVFKSAMVCSRPSKTNRIKILLTYETLSETHWNAEGIEANFIPNYFVNIEKEIRIKIKAIKCYKSQIKNQARSIRAVQSLSEFRGSQNFFKNAEAFKLVRLIS